MNRLPHWNITDKFPAFFDLESATAIEQTAKLYGAMNALIDSYNEWVDKVNADIDAFENSTDKNIEEFAMGLRQEFQDFIDTVELKLLSQDKEIQNAVDYMTKNLNDSVSKMLKEIKENGELSEEILKAFNDKVSYTDIVDNFESEAGNLPASARTVKVLNEKFTNYKWSTYYDPVNQLGATSYLFKDVINAMPNFSIVESTIDSYVSPNNLPFSYGSVRITKVNDWRITIHIVSITGSCYSWTGNKNELDNIKLSCSSIRTSYELSFLSNSELFSTTQIFCERTGNIVNVYFSGKTAAQIPVGTIIELTGNPKTVMVQNIGSLTPSGNSINVQVSSEKIEFSLSKDISSGTWFRFNFSYICTD